MEARTWQEFTEDLVSDGRSLKHIKAVAFHSRWENFLPEIISYVKKLNKIIKFKPLNNLKEDMDTCYNQLCLTCQDFSCASNPNKIWRIAN